MYLRKMQKAWAAMAMGREGRKIPAMALAFPNLMKTAAMAPGQKKAISEAPASAPGLAPTGVSTRKAGGSNTRTIHTPIIAGNVLTADGIALTNQGIFAMDGCIGKENGIIAVRTGL